MNGVATIQQTLFGDEAEDGRIHPDTLVVCPECDERLLRSEIYDHEHEVSPRADRTKTVAQAELPEKVPDHAMVDTQTYRVEFHYEMVEQVVVEAASKGEAREAAERKRSYDGEIMDTIHCRKRSLDDPSQATIEYLEEYGLLPDDHNLTRDDIKRVCEMGGDD